MITAEEIEKIIQVEARKQDFDFIYKIIPGMMLKSGRALEEISFDGFEVHFLIRLPEKNIIRAFRTTTGSIEVLTSLIVGAIQEVRTELLTRLK